MLRFNVADFDVVEVDDCAGTPLFMAPETLSHKYCCGSDIWSLGVMTYQLLCGRMPFTDRDDPMNPALSKIWFSILHLEPQFNSKAWMNISDEAKDFVSACLVKNHKERVTLSQCLEHAWLTKTDCDDRFIGPALKCEPFKYDDGFLNANSIKFE